MGWLCILDSRLQDYYLTKGDISFCDKEGNSTNVFTNFCIYEGNIWSCSSQKYGYFLCDPVKVSGENELRGSQ